MRQKRNQREETSTHKLDRHRLIIQQIRPFENHPKTPFPDFLSDFIMNSDNVARRSGGCTGGGGVGGGSVVGWHVVCERG